MRTRGYTLIELLSVLAIFGIVTIYVGQILIVNEHAYHTVEQTSESQQNLRLFAEMMQDDLRHAGMMVSLSAAICGRDNLNAPDQLYASDAAAIDPQEDFTPYTGAQVSGLSNLPVGSSQVVQLDSLVIEPSPPNRPAYDTNGDGNPDSDFRVGGGVIVADRTLPERGAACGRITNVDLANQRITVVAVTALAANASTTLIAVPANEYRLNGTQLLWNGIALAEGIEDLQVAFVFDQDLDNQIDAADDLRGYDGGTQYTSAEIRSNWLRELEISLVSRARREDPEFVGQPQGALNHAYATPPTDGFRRRKLEGRVRLRNLVARLET